MHIYERQQENPTPKMFLGLSGLSLTISKQPPVFERCRHFGHPKYFQVQWGQVWKNKGNQTMKPELWTPQIMFSGGGTFLEGRCKKRNHTMKPEFS